MEIINTPEIGVRLLELLARTALGETFQIMQDGRPVGMLVPPPPVSDSETRDAAVRQLKSLRRSFNGQTITDWRAIAHEGHKY